MSELSTMAALVLLGGLFGWTLGKMPDKWALVAILVAIGLVIISLGVPG